MALKTLLDHALKAHRDGRLSDAQNLYQTILKHDSEHIAALSNLGQIARLQDDIKTALGYYEKAASTAIAPGQVWFNLANTYRALERYDAALTAYQEAFRRAPELKAAVVQEAVTRGLQLNAQNHVSASEALTRGETLFEKGLIDQAEKTFCIALNEHTCFAHAATRLASIYLANNKAETAAIFLEEVVKREPDTTSHWSNLATLYKRMHHTRKALQALERALALKPNDTTLLRETANIYTSLGWPEKAHDIYKQLIQQENKPDDTISSFLMATLYDPSVSAQTIAEHHRKLTENWPVVKDQCQVHLRPDSEKTNALRIGYISGDLSSQNHPVKQFIAPLIERHAQAGVVCYSFGTNSLHTPNISTNIKGLHHTDIARMSESEAISTIKSAQLDILVDLSGHTSGNRLRFFGQRLARVHASYLGYPSSTGFTGIDVLIADPIVCPASLAQLYSERIVYLPDSFLCFSPPKDMPEPENNRTHKQIRFGSLNNLPKLNSFTLSLWSKVLKAIPDSELVIKCGQFNELETCNEIASRLADTGLDPKRLILEKPEAFSDAMRAYERFDIALDPYPYNGGTTSCHALWMGCPVITLEGDYFVRRMGASILNAAGRSEWVAKTEHEYVRIAMNFASSKSQLRAIQSSLVSDIRQRPITDINGFAKELLTLYQGLVNDTLSA